jgi:hypothetical protein
MLLSALLQRHDQAVVRQEIALVIRTDEYSVGVDREIGGHLAAHGTRSDGARDGGTCHGLAACDGGGPSSPTAPSQQVQQQSPPPSAVTLTGVPLHGMVTEATVVVARRRSLV